MKIIVVRICAVCVCVCVIFFHTIVIVQLCHILFDNNSTDDIISLFDSHKLINVDDSEILQHFAQNKYLQKQFLLKYLQNLKLTDWLAICNILLKVKTLEQTSHRLLNSKLYNCVRTYVCVLRLASVLALLYS